MPALDTPARTTILVILVLAALVGGVAWSLADTGTETAESAPDAGPDTAAENGDQEPEYLALPDGINRNGITNARALVQGHADVVTETGYVYTFQSTREREDEGTTTLNITYYRDNAGERVYEESVGHYQNATGEVTSESVTERFVDARAGEFYVRQEENGRPSYIQYPGDSEAVDVLMGFAGETFIHNELVAFEYEFVELVDVETTEKPAAAFRVTDVRDPETLGIGDNEYEVEGALVVDTEGRIHHASHQLAVPAAGYSDEYSYTLQQTGGISINHPPWYEEAVQQAEWREDPAGPSGPRD